MLNVGEKLKQIKDKAQSKIIFTTLKKFPVVKTRIDDIIYLEIIIKEDGKKDIFLYVDKKRYIFNVPMNVVDLLQGYLNKSDKIIKSIFAKIDLKQENFSFVVTYNDGQTFTKQIN